MTNTIAEFDKDIIHTFHTEVMEIINELDDELILFEEQLPIPADDLVNKIFRGVHTVKGNAGFVGLTAINQLSHAMEDLFSEVRNKTLTIEKVHMDHLFAGLDLLKEMMTDLPNSNDTDFHHLLKTYQDIIAGRFQESLETSPSLAQCPAPALENTEPSPLLEKFFASTDLIERVVLLQDIENTKDTRAIAGLWPCIAEPFADDALNIVIDSTLKSLLKLKRQYILQGLCHPSPRVLTLCAHLAGKYQLQGSIPALLDILETATDKELLRSALHALGRLGDPALIDFIKDFALDVEPVISSTAIAALATIDPHLEGLLLSFQEMDEISALTLLNVLTTEADESIITFLADNIHHSNSVIRRVVAEKLIAIGPESGPRLATKLLSGDRDEKIMAANILGKLGNQQMIPFLIQTCRAKDSNIRFATYEALGLISISQSGYTCFEGILDEDLTIRTLVLHFMDKDGSALVAGKLRRAIQKDTTQANLITEAMCHVSATSIVARLQEYDEILAILFNRIKAEAADKIYGEYEAWITASAPSTIKNSWQQYERQEIEKNNEQIKVLIVDDSATTRRITENILSKNGYILFAAEDGQQALDILADQPVDIIITDMNMPIKNGIELARDIRQHPVLSDLPMVMVTTEQSAQEKHAALEAGINHFLEKPFKRQELLKTIEKLLL